MKIIFYLSVSYILSHIDFQSFHLIIACFTMLQIIIMKRSPEGENTACTHISYLYSLYFILIHSLYFNWFTAIWPTSVRFGLNYAVCHPVVLPLFGKLVYWLRACSEVFNEYAGSITPNTQPLSQIVISILAIVDAFQFSEFSGFVCFNAKFVAIWQK